MCGLFGVIKAGERRSAEGDDFSSMQNRANATMAFAYLGYRAMERGRDAAGIAMFRGRLHQAAASTPTSLALSRKRNLRLDGWIITRRGHRFSRLWQPPTHQYQYRDQAEQAKTLMGHTRQSTIGATTALTNTSPLVVGELIGTHNGGVAMRHLVSDWSLDTSTRLGQTSSEVIFAALDQVVYSSRATNASQKELELERIVTVLESLRGRAALVWVNRSEPNTVYLARTALSPLAIAWDRFGNFYWASNYHWFLDLDAQTGDFFGFNSVQRLREGTLMVVKPERGAKCGLQTIRTEQRTELVVAEERHFQPFARLSDWKLAAAASRQLWRGFTAEDEEWEQLNSTFKVKEMS